MSEIEINGMAHVILTVSRFSEARQFYKSLLPKFGMICVMDGQDFCYHVGGRTAIGIRRCDPEFSAETFQQYRVCLLYTSPSPRDAESSRMPSSA